jgi:hypothetical protein
LRRNIAEGYREVLDLVRQTQREIPPEDDDDEFDDGLPFAPVSVSFGGMGGGGVPPILRKLLDRGGIEALSELMSIIEKPLSAKSQKQLDRLIKPLGLSRHEVLMGIMEWARQALHSLNEEDAADVERLIGLIAEAEAGGDAAALTELVSELDELLFYAAG